MKSLLIKDTTKEERERIVHQALWGNCGIDCEFCGGSIRQLDQRIVPERNGQVQCFSSDKKINDFQSIFNQSPLQ